MATAAQVKAHISVPADTLTDDDITALVGDIPSIIAAAAAVCRRLSTFYASRVDISSGQQRVMSSQAAEMWLKLARDFEVRGNIIASPVVAGAAPSSIDFDQFENHGNVGDSR